MGWNFQEVEGLKTRILCAGDLTGMDMYKMWKIHNRILPNLFAEDDLGQYLTQKR